tara:strand:- start:49 stop:924 length:876 start_codon:yes stop_codon:yes gene_type:complete
MQEKKSFKIPFEVYEIEEYKTEDEFMFALVELYKLMIEQLYSFCNHKYQDQNGEFNTMSRMDSVIAGNVARLIKLSTSFLQNICEGKSEICFILDRCIAETCINLKLILLNPEEKSKQDYIKYSLKTEKKLHDTITKNIESRDGIELPIEKRMKESIESSFNSSGLELKDVNKNFKWKNVYERTKAIGEEFYYKTHYGISSHSIHGNWQEIMFNHLNENENGFQINLSWKKPRPQLIEGSLLQILDTTKIIIENEIVNETIKKELLNNYKLLLAASSLLSFKHEELINNSR